LKFLSALRGRQAHRAAAPHPRDMVFIDSNVPVYLVGVAHPNKVDAQRRLEALVTDAALHIATLQRDGIEGVLSFDAAFDRMPGLTCIR
jgi:predicted nucleic acid-binding protein